MNDLETEREFIKLWDKIKEIESKLQDNGSSSPKNSREAANKKQSIKEFIISIDPSSDVKITLCLGYYLEKIEGKNTFTNKEIIESFRKAKCQIPQNVSDKIQKAISNGWLDNGSTKGTFTLTATGEKVVENKFSNSQND